MFQTDQESCFAQSTIQFTHALTFIDSLLSHEDLGSLSVIVIIVMHIFRKEFQSIVKMLIHTFCRTTVFLHMCICNGFYLRITGLDLLIEPLIPFLVIRPPVFITDFQISHLEGLRMSHVSAQFSPFAFFWPNRVLDGVQRIFQGFLQSIPF